MAQRPPRSPNRVDTVEALIYLDLAVVLVLVLEGKRWALVGLVGLWLAGRARAP